MSYLIVEHLPLFISLFLLIIIIFLVTQIETKQKYIAKVEKEYSNLARLYQSALEKIEVLSGIREISYSLNMNSSLDRILNDFLVILSNSLSLRKSDFIAVYILEENAIIEKGRIYGTEKASIYSERVNNKGIEDIVSKLKERMNIIRVITETKFEIYVPIFLSDDLLTREAMNDTRSLASLKGFLLASFSTDVEEPHTEDYYRNKEEILLEFTKILVLTFKTPTLYQKAIKDNLTGLYNKEHFETELEMFFGIAQRTKQPLSLIMIDIDNFKSINDTYGHICGDIVLKEIAKCVKNNVRHYNTCYRYGGEEIAVILPGTDISNGYHIAERLRQKVEKLNIKIDRGKYINVTISLGISEVDANTFEKEALIRNADAALYRAKASGKNCVVSFS